MAESWSIRAENNVRDIKGSLEAARDEWIADHGRDVASDEAKQQVRAAVTAAEVFVSSGGAGVGGVVIELSGTWEQWLTGGTFSLTIHSVPEEEAETGEVFERDPEAPRETSPDAPDVIVTETGTASEPRGVTMLPAGLQAQVDAETKAEEARLQVEAGVRDPSFVEEGILVEEPPPEDEPPEDDGDDEDDPGELTKAEIQDRLRDLGLPTSGNKPELLARLEEADEG